MNQPTQEDLDRLQRGNQRRIMDLQAQGVGLNIPAAPQLFVETLIEALIGPPGSEAWIAFVHTYELKVRAALDEADSQVNRAKLLAPAPNGVGPSPQIPPMPSR